MPKYLLRYLPQFHKDLTETAQYIATELLNPEAVTDLINAVEQAVLERQSEAEAFEQFHSRKERKHPYYRIYVNNFIVFYVIITENDHKVMEVRRFLYGKSNWKRTI